MKRDKAISKILKAEVTPTLSPAFNAQLMSQIHKFAEKKKVQSFILTLCLISATSLSIIGMAIYLLRNYLKWNFSFSMPRFPQESISQYGFFIYIALLMLILIGLDTFFRHIRQKHKDNELKQIN
jgi:hypothetical protein